MSEEFISEVEVEETDLNDDALAAIDADWGDVDFNDNTDEGETDFDSDNGDEAEADQQSDVAEENHSEEEPTETPAEADQPFTVNYLGETKTVSRDEATTFIQKGMDYDRIKEKWEQAKSEKPKSEFYESFIKDLAESSGLSVEGFLDSVKARMLIASATKDGKEMSETEAMDKARIAREKALTPVAEETPTEQPAEARQQENRQASFLRFAQEYPDVKPSDIPKTVWEDYAGGKGDLADLYARYENKQLKQELEAMKQNEKNRARSTGSRQTAGANGKDKFDELWYDGT